MHEMVLRGPARCTIPGAVLMVAEQTFITGPPPLAQGRSGGDDDGDDSDGAAR